MEDAFGNKIILAQQEKVAVYATEMDHVLAAIAFFMNDDPQKFLKSVWVSDLSCVGDFNLDEDEVAKIGEALGVSVGDGDFLWLIAKAIHERKN